MSKNLNTFKSYLKELDFNLDSVTEKKIDGRTGFMFNDKIETVNKNISTGIFFDDEDNFVDIFATFVMPIEVNGGLYEKLNDLNKNYRYLTFYIDKMGEDKYIVVKTAVFTGKLFDKEAVVESFENLRVVAQNEYKNLIEFSK